MWADHYIFDISKHKLIYFQFWPAVHIYRGTISFIDKVGQSRFLGRAIPVFEGLATKCVQQNILIHIIMGVFDEIDVLEIRSEICASGPGRHKSRILSPIRAAGPDRRLTTACTFSSLSQFEE